MTKIARHKSPIIKNSFHSFTMGLFIIVDILAITPVSMDSDTNKSNNLDEIRLLSKIHHTPFLNYKNIFIIYYKLIN